MKLNIIGLILSSWITNLLAADVRLVDLEPNDAAQYINRQDQTLRYAPKIDSHVPALRYLGNQQQRVLEDIYLANQYHGQDGLGAYIYGYSVPDIAKTEKKERSGDLKGAYEYIAGNGQEIKVQYWDDGTGFHQIDNVPKNLPEDDPDVKAAKEEHLRIWHEQALRNSIPPADPNQHYFEQQQQHLQQPQPIQHIQLPQQIQHVQQPQPIQHLQLPQPPQPIPQSVHHYQQPQGVITQNINHHVDFTNQGYPQIPIPPSIVPLHHNSVEYAGQYSSNQQAYARAPASAQLDSSSRSVEDNAHSHSTKSISVEKSWSQGPAASASQVASQTAWAPQGFGQQSIQQSQESRVGLASAVKHEEDEEQTGPPKGFFYSFDYPVGIIVGKDGQGQQQLSAIYNQNKEYHEQQLKRTAS